MHSFSLATHGSSVSKAHGWRYWIVSIHGLTLHSTTRMARCIGSTETQAHIRENKVEYMLYVPYRTICTSCTPVHHPHLRTARTDLYLLLEAPCCTYHDVQDRIVVYLAGPAHTVTLTRRSHNIRWIKSFIRVYIYINTSCIIPYMWRSVGTRVVSVG